MLKHLGSIKVKLMILMLSVVVLLIIVMGLLQQISVSRVFQEMDTQRQALVEDNILKLMKATDSAYRMLERPIEKESEIILGRMIDAYLLSGLPGIDLYDFYDADSGIDLYIIDGTNTVIDATYKTDIGLNLGQFEGVGEFLQGIREQGKFFSDRLSLSSVEDIVTKYCYQPTPDGLYIFETGYQIRNDQAIPDALNFGSFGDIISKNQGFVLSASLFSKYGTTFNEDAAEVKYIDPEYKLYYEESLSTRLPVTFEGTYRGQAALIKYLPFSFENAGELHEHTVIEIIYSRADLEATKNRITLQMLVIGLLGSAAVVFFAAVMSNRLLSPLKTLHEGIERVSKGDFDSRIVIRSNDEFSYIADHFNGMTEKIRQSIEDQQRREEEIRGLYQKETTLNRDILQVMEANKQNYFETIRALANAEEEKDPYTRGHCERVMDHALGIGKALGLPEESLNALRYGAILHDIGKIGVPEQVLNKETPLDKEEFALIRQHPSMGLRILGDLTFMKDSIRIVHEHHERYDGHGYPSGLRDQEIDLLARIVCVADSFDAMTSKRPYRKTAMTQKEAVQELRDKAGTQFDPEIVEVFVSLLEQGALRREADIG